MFTGQLSMSRMFVVPSHTPRPPFGLRRSKSTIVDFDREKSLKASASRPQCSPTPRFWLTQIEIHDRGFRSRKIPEGVRFAAAVPS